MPTDRRLPALANLLDPERSRDAVRRAPGLAGAEEVAVRYLEWVPGRSFLVQLRVRGDGAEHEVVASQGRLAVRGETSDGDDGVRLEVFPADGGLPLLADPALMCALLDLDPATPVQRLSWVPQQRAVLRVGAEVVKLAPDEAGARRSWACLQAAVGRLPVPPPLRADLAHGLTVQALAPGRPLGRSDAPRVANRAGVLLRKLHGGSREGLATRRSADLLVQCGPVVAVVAAALPELADRVQHLAAALAVAAPGADLVPSHGDFSVDQLIEGGSGSGTGTLAVVDTDTLCAAPAAFDLAAFAANQVSGRKGDLARAGEVLAALVTGYGSRPGDLDWWLAVCLLRRLDRGVRRLKHDWPQRTHRLLDDAEAVLARVG